MSNLNRSAFQGHPLHLVSPSPWPIFTCISLLTLTTSGVLIVHGLLYVGCLLPFALVLLIASMFFLFRHVISEKTYSGNHAIFHYLSGFFSLLFNLICVLTIYSLIWCIIYFSFKYLKLITPEFFNDITNLFITAYTNHSWLVDYLVIGLILVSTAKISLYLRTLLCTCNIIVFEDKLLKLLSPHLTSKQVYILLHYTRHFIPFFMVLVALSGKFRSTLNRLFVFLLDLIYIYIALTLLSFFVFYVCLFFDVNIYDFLRDLGVHGEFYTVCSYKPFGNYDSRQMEWFVLDLRYCVNYHMQNNVNVPLSGLLYTHGSAATYALSRTILAHIINNHNCFIHPINKMSPYVVKEGEELVETTRVTASSLAIVAGVDRPYASVIIHSIFWGI